MGIDLTIKIGGEAGQGIQTVGALLSSVCQRAGLYVMAVNDFESRIRGGHNFFQIRIADHPVRAPDDRINLLVGMDDRTALLHEKELVPGGLIVVDSKSLKTPDGRLSIPISSMAKQAGGQITANTVAAGICLSLLGAPLELFESVIEKRFGAKSQKVVEQNREAARLGYQSVAEVVFDQAFKWEKRTGDNMVLSGNQCIGLGALAGDCRFAAFYPMSPSTGINLFLVSVKDRFPLVVEQVEDEIAAINMAIGASFAGVRAMTATSGGGFCLMTEGVGLAGITETPVVIVNAQRPGPATGLATRTAQADLHFVIHAAQDEFPRFIFAPGTPEDAYETTARAFDLADKYQVPAIVLTDQFFNDSMFTVEAELTVPDAVRTRIDRDGRDTGSGYKRYAYTPSGVSPRRAPCHGDALVLVSGNEHEDSGHLTEVADIRNRMVDKRQAKLVGMRSEMSAPKVGFGESETVLIGWGSTYGVIREVTERCRKANMDVGYVHFTDLWPFPEAACRDALGRARQIISIENNTTGQLAQLIRSQTGIEVSGRVLKYDGRPFYVSALMDDVARQIEG